jgi:hypothetical protein
VSNLFRLSRLSAWARCDIKKGHYPAAAQRAPVWHSERESDSSSLFLYVEISLMRAQVGSSHAPPFCTNALNDLAASPGLICIYWVATNYVCASSSSLLLEKLHTFARPHWARGEIISWKSALLEEGICNYTSAYIIIHQVNWRRGTVFLLWAYLFVVSLRLS